MDFQFRIAKPVSELAYLCLIAIIDVSPGAEQFDFRKARIPSSLQPEGGEAMADKKVRR